VTALYLDSSAFVKLIVEEPESAALRAYLAGTDARPVASALLRTEVLRAVRLVGHEALATAREALRRIDLVGIDDRLLDAAGLLDPRILRTLDAIHLATAIALGDDLEAILTYDQRLAAAARLVGLPTTAPA
jgi:predicted nucleic acid-binding protein